MKNDDFEESVSQVNIRNSKQGDRINPSLLMVEPEPTPDEE